MEIYKNRNEVPEKYKWDLTSFFKNEEQFNRILNRANLLAEELGNYSDCVNDGKKLYEFLEKNSIAISLFEDLNVYAYLINDQELGNSESIERKNKAMQLAQSIENNTSFLNTSLLKISSDEYKKLFFDEPRLLEYEAYLNKIYRQKGHVLTENEEKIVSSLVNSMNHFSDISSNLINNNHNYGDVELEDGTIEEVSTANYGKLMCNDNMLIRKNVYSKFNEVLKQYADTSAYLLNSYVAMNDTVSKIHHFDSSWDSKLFGLNLTNKTFEVLVNTVQKNLHVLQKYFLLKKEALGLDILHQYDLALEIANCKKEYSIEDAQELVLNAVKPLGDEYQMKMKKVFDSRYIDYCQYKGKRSGGYSFSSRNQDSRILLNFNHNLDSVSAIVHEGGHNVHHQYINENNPLQYRSTSSIIAEVASLTNECLLSSYLAKNGATKEEKLSGIANILGVIASNLFGIVREGKMEQDMYETVHNGGMLTKDYMNDITLKSLQKYYGDTIEMDEYTKYGWITRRHYYNHFYLYSYAICISVASTVASKILAGDGKMLENYLKFLKCGSDKWPSEVYSILGIDIESEDVYISAIEYFDSLIEMFNEISNEDFN